MLCRRCGGLLMQNWWVSKEGVQERMPSTRCVNCGCIDDPVDVEPTDAREHDLPASRLLKGALFGESPLCCRN